MAAVNITQLETLLYPIADVLCLNLEWKAKTKRIEGEQDFRIHVTKGVDMEVKVSVVSAFANRTGQAGVLAHIVGHLYLAVAYNEKKSTVTAWIIDSAALGVRRIDMVDIWPKNASIKEAAVILQDGVKMAFFRDVYDTTWKQVKFPKQEKVATHSRAGS